MRGRYGLNHLRGDVFGGITAGIIALPLALAFGAASGAGAAAGLYGAIAIGSVAAIFGGTSTQISGPTGPMTVVMASAFAAFPGNLPAIVAIVLITGLLQCVFGFLRVGTYVKFVPYPVISGFMSGIGVIIILLQTGPLFGVAGASSPLAALLAFGDSLSDLDTHSLLLGVLTMIIVFFTPPRVSRVLPSPLIALVGVTLFSVLAGYGVPTIGDIPSGLPALRLPSIHPGEARQVLMLALTLAILGSIDSLLTSLVADSLTKDRHDSSRELLGQGLGNIASALAGGIAGAGATMRTVINIKTGGTTRLSGVVHAAFLLAVLLGLGPVMSRIPTAVLAGILVKVGVDIFDYRFLKIIGKAPRHDIYVMFAVFLSTVFVDLIVAVAAGITLAAVLLAVRMARQTKLSISGVSDDGGFADLEQELQKASDFQIRIVTIRGPFFFGAASQILDNVDRLLGTKVVLFDCLDVPFMDLSASFALEEMISGLKAGGIASVLALRENSRELLLDLGFGTLVGSEMMFESYEDALYTARRLIETDGED